MNKDKLIHRLAYPAAGVLLAVGVGFAALAGPGHFRDPAPVQPGTVTVEDGSGHLVEHVLPACPTEDADNCYWIAGPTSGNGQGRDFYVIDGVVTYTSK